LRKLDFQKAEKLDNNRAQEELKVKKECLNKKINLFSTLLNKIVELVQDESMHFYRKSAP